MEGQQRNEGLGPLISVKEYKSQKDGVFFDMNGQRFESGCRMDDGC